jgi:hypothetical protein
VSVWLGLLGDGGTGRGLRVGGSFTLLLVGIDKRLICLSVSSMVQFEAR